MHKRCFPWKLKHSKNCYTSSIQSPCLYLSLLYPLPFRNAAKHSLSRPPHPGGPLGKGLPPGLLTHCWLPFLSTPESHYSSNWWLSPVTISELPLPTYTAILSKAFSRTNSFQDISKTRSFLKPLLPKLELIQSLFSFPWVAGSFLHLSSLIHLTNWKL